MRIPTCGFEACVHWSDYVNPNCEANLSRGIQAYQFDTFLRSSIKTICIVSDVVAVSGSSQLTWGLLYISVHHPLAYQCKGCKLQHASLNGLLAHVEGSVCTESVPASDQGADRNTWICVILWRMSMFCAARTTMFHLQGNDVQDA